MAACVGVFITVPVSLAALMYAYEEMFSPSASRLAPPIESGAPAGSGRTFAPHSAPRTGPAPLLLGGFAAVFILLLVLAGAMLLVRHGRAVKPPRENKPAVVSGVGLSLERDAETHQLVVKRTFPNSPAEEAGIASGLVLNKVNGVLAEEKSINEVSALLRGAAGTEVALEFIDPENGTTNQVQLTRRSFDKRSR
jgi:hypothetical protein